MKNRFLSKTGFLQQLDLRRGPARPTETVASPPAASTTFSKATVRPFSEGSPSTSSPGAGSGRTRTWQTSARGIELIKRFEGFRGSLYDDDAGHCTIGYGTLVHRGPTDGRASEQPFVHGVSEAEATELLRGSLAAFEGVVNEAVTVELAQHEVDALLSFVYNVGPANFRSSTLLRKLNAGERGVVPGELKKWVYAGGRVLAGLVRRRAAEAELFATARYAVSMSDDATSSEDAGTRDAAEVSGDDDGDLACTPEADAARSDDAPIDQAGAKTRSSDALPVDDAEKGEDDGAGGGGGERNSWLASLTTAGSGSLRSTHLVVSGKPMHPFSATHGFANWVDHGKSSAWPTNVWCESIGGIGQKAAWVEMRDPQPVTQIVLHETGGDSGFMRDMHTPPPKPGKKPNVTIGIHFLVERNGMIYQLGDLAKRYTHPSNGDIARQSIGIEISGRSLSMSSAKPKADEIPLHWGYDYKTKTFVHTHTMVLPKDEQLVALWELVQRLGELYPAVGKDVINASILGGNHFFLSTNGQKINPHVPREPVEVVPGIISHSIINEHGDGAAPAAYVWAMRQKPDHKAALAKMRAIVTATILTSDEILDQWRPQFKGIPDIAAPEWSDKNRSGHKIVRIP